MEKSVLPGLPNLTTIRLATPSGICSIIVCLNFIHVPIIPVPASVSPVVRSSHGPGSGTALAGVFTDPLGLAVVRHLLDVPDSPHLDGLPGSIRLFR